MVRKSKADADILRAFKSKGPGWQTKVNAALRDWLASHASHDASPRATKETSQFKTGTVNFTASVDRSLLERAKVIAAKSKTSVNALFNTELRHLVETYEAAEATGNENFATLLDFSLGRITGVTALDRLGLDGEEELFLLMAHAHLPMPRLSEALTHAMALGLATLLR